ncbi:MAG: PilN domain-containing protein [Candidatus Marinimicrobia bacterium]|nr:PilN domain-containing protein [Candidatus Neomarinimicrobiota bacterium]MDA8753438.1 PilN domain-containing protein [Candidatus Neomarinimicrobiota bacterium]
MSKQYIIINLNKAESAETLIERSKERVRWILFGLLVTVLLGANVRVWMISLGYNGIIEQKETEIGRLKGEIDQLQSQGKNLSKYDILSFADLEQDRFLWAQNLEKMGSLTPGDIAITGLRYKRNKLVLKGIALTFEDRKDFEIIDEYVQTLRNNEEFSGDFNRIKYVGHSKVSIRGQDIIRFEIEASIKKNNKKLF